MERLNVHEAKTRLSAVPMEIEGKGKSFVICRKGKPVVELIPNKKVSRLAYHPLLGNIGIKYDPTEDLSAEEWGKVH